MTTPIRLGVVCDLREEGWHSMDLIADMLMQMLPQVAADQIAPTRLCPPMPRRWTRLPWVGGAAHASLGDRLTGRLWDYPRWLAPRAADFDLFHIVDHSYAHLVRALWPHPAIVTCNDVDAIEAALPGRNNRFHPARLLAAGVLDGLARAAHIACISETTRTQLLATGRINPDRVSVVYLGVHPSCTPAPDPRWDREVDKRLGPRRVELLHVGSTIPRKRIDTLLEVLRGVRDTIGDATLLRVGGPLTPAQRTLAHKLGVADAIVEFPFVERPVLAALYRRASLVLLPSDREGFGLPLVEAMACGTPVVASAIPALQEVAGDAATFCPPGDVPQWVASIDELLRQKETDPAGWERRTRRCILSAGRFNWTSYAADMAKRYVQTVAGGAAGAPEDSGLVRVLHLGKFYPPVKGGMETILKLICEHTSGQVDNQVMVANDRCALNEERHGSIAVTRLPAIAKIGAVAVCPTLPMRLADEPADLIVLHEPNPMALLAYFIARPSPTLVVWFHSEVIRPSWRYRLFYRPFLQFALQRAIRIVVSSPTLVATSPVLKPWQHKCVVIPFGVEEHEMADQVLHRAEEIRREHPCPIVLFVGRLVPYKGVDVLLEAMREVPAVALLVGDGPEREALEHQAKTLDVADRVRFLGEVSDAELAALYRACDLFVLPSITRQEAFGVVLLEAMACGKPVVSTDLGTGTAWVNQDRETGLVIPPRDAAALHDAITSLVAEPGLRNSLGDGARRRARTVFSVDRMIDAVLALYREVGGRQIGGRAA